jgi:hypothetical protein
MATARDIQKEMELEASINVLDIVAVFPAANSIGNSVFSPFLAQVQEILPAPNHLEKFVIVKGEFGDKFVVDLNDVRMATWEEFVAREVLPSN